MEYEVESDEDWCEEPEGENIEVGWVVLEGVGGM